MAAPALSREVALRVGLAARALPGTDIRRLMEVLVLRLGTPLSEASLKTITVTDLRTALVSLDGEEDSEETAVSKDALKLAVRYLWGEGVEEAELPRLEAYTEGEMPRSVRVAVASNAGERLDGHYGSCPHFLVYQVSADEIRLIDIRPTHETQDAEDRNAARAALIDDCDVMYVQSIGGPAAAKVVRAGLYPIKVPQGGDVREALAQLQDVLKGSPPPWLAKAIGATPALHVTGDEE